MDLLTTKKEGVDQISFYELGAALLWADRILVLILYPILILPRLLTVFFEFTDPSLLILSQVFEHLIGLSFLFLIARRAFAGLGASSLNIRFLPSTLFFLLGIATWIVFKVPFYLSVVEIPLQLKFALLLITLFLIGLYYAYYFLFFPLLGQIQSVRESLKLARQYTREDIYLPIKANLAPLAIMMLVSGLVSIPAPDGRYLWSVYINEGSSLLFWVLSCYLALGAGFANMPQPFWELLRLDKYRQARLTTLVVQMPTWLPKLLRPKVAAQILVLGGLVWLGNVVRLSQMAPAVKIEVSTIKVRDKSLDLVLSISDDNFEYRGFHPIQFRLAGPERTVISPFPVSAHIGGSEEDVRFVFPSQQSQSSNSLTLHFDTQKPATEIVELKDLYLWYGGVRMILLDFSTAQVEKPSENPEEIERQAEETSLSQTRSSQSSSTEGQTSQVLEPE